MVVSITGAEGPRKKAQHLSKRELSSQRIALLKLMQRVNFGRIEGLVIRDGEPLLEPPPKVIREVKFGGENGPRPEFVADDFLLKSQVVELISYFDRIGSGTIDCLDVKHGLPFRLIVSETAA